MLSTAREVYEAAVMLWIQRGFWAHIYSITGLNRVKAERTGRKGHFRWNERCKSGKSLRASVGATGSRSWSEGWGGESESLGRKMISGTTHDCVPWYTSVKSFPSNWQERKYIQHKVKWNCSLRGDTDDRILKLFFRFSFPKVVSG